MLTKKDKEKILEIFKHVDVKLMDLDGQSEEAVKWFRFGSYNGMAVASEIIKNMPERGSKKTTKIEVKSL